MTDTLRATMGATGGPIRVLIVEDQRVLAEAVALSLQQERDITVVGRESDADGAVRAVRGTSPDVVVMDYHLPERDGLAATKEIHEIRPGLPVIMLTGDTSDDVLLAALNSGVNGFLVKDEPFAELIASVRRAAQGEVIWPADRLARLLARGPRPPADGHAGSTLTDRERDVLALMCEGLDNKSIASRLGISLTTVRGYVQSILAKLGVHSKLEAVVLASRSGLAATLSR